MEREIRFLTFQVAAVLHDADANACSDAVNKASRTSGLSAPGVVLVSDIVPGWARTSARVVLDDRGEFALKGINDPQRVFAVRKREG